MLECEALETYYGAAHVLYGMSLAVRTTMNIDGHGCWANGR